MQLYAEFRWRLKSLRVVLHTDIIRFLIHYQVQVTKFSLTQEGNREWTFRMPGHQPLPNFQTNRLCCWKDSQQYNSSVKISSTRKQLISGRRPRLKNVLWLSFLKYKQNANQSILITVLRLRGTPHDTMWCQYKATWISLRMRRYEIVCSQMFDPEIEYPQRQRLWMRR